MQPLMVFNKQPPLFEMTIFIFPLANSCSLLFCPQTLKEQQGNEKQTHLQQSLKKKPLHKYLKKCTLYLGSYCMRDFYQCL